MAVYENQVDFYKSTGANDGDSSYDHIVPILGFSSLYNDSLYHADDIIYFSDNGESSCIGATNKYVCNDYIPQFYYNYTVSDLIGTR